MAASDDRALVMAQLAGLLLAHGKAKDMAEALDQASDIMDAAARRAEEDASAR